VAEETEKFRFVSLSSMKVYEPLISVTIKIPGDGEAFSAFTSALGGDIWIPVLENYFESCQFRRRS